MTARTSDDARRSPIPGDTYTSNQGAFTVVHVTDDHDVWFKWPDGYEDFVSLCAWALGSGTWVPAPPPTLEKPCA